MSKQKLIPNITPGYFVATYREADELGAASFELDPVIAWLFEEGDDDDSEPHCFDGVRFVPTPITFDGAKHLSAGKGVLLKLPDGRFDDVWVMCFPDEASALGYCGTNIRRAAAESLRRVA